jgi:hypothetical protein
MTCSITLRLQGKPYPRTCKKCGLGPCIAQPTAQPEQEPVVCCQQYDTCLKPCTPRGVHLAQRTWVGLTDEEIEVLFQIAAGADEEVHIRFARAIESKLKEINCVG